MIANMTFVIASLAIWRLSYLIVDEEGPFDVFYTFRRLLGVHLEDGVIVANNVFAKLVLCIYCTTVWVSLPFALILFTDAWLLYWFALGAGSLLVHRLIIDRG